MIKILPVGPSLINTPFTDKEDINFFLREGVKISDAIDADLIVSGTFKKLLTFMLRFGRSKKYLLWTLEPRFSKHFIPQISYPLLPTFHVMNVYNGIFSDNYFFTPRYPIELNYKGFSGFNSKRIVSLMTYQAGHKWKLFYQGNDIDLCNLRTKIALEGYSRGILDIYGRGWSDKIKVGQSRGKGWREKKIMILQQYNFNLCFENTNWHHYCTEKIWDSIQGGCLPIYYGKGNSIYDDFPRNSFLDYSDFNSSDLLFDYIQNIKLDEFQERMNLCIQAFNQAVRYKQEKQPHQKLLQQTLLKIREILQ
ncbi:MAG: glycosyltransferase family 10 [Calothrix sp. MO_167.B12]|nr:glycosyltransferase family 10 [Calothrix sp. MO_167.B12]